ncbi:MAG TPA: hypothetical protein VIV82_08870, partial [Verrucomicrobiae bacterium]
STVVTPLSSKPNRIVKVCAEIFSQHKPLKITAGQKIEAFEGADKDRSIEESRLVGGFIIIRLNFIIFLSAFGSCF